MKLPWNKSKRRVLAFFADTHAGSEFSLLPPGIKLWKQDNSGDERSWSPALTPQQEELWDLYTGHVERVLEFAGEDPVVVVHVGDLCQGNHFKEELTVSSIANQTVVAAGVLSYWMPHKNVDMMRLITGTDVHEFGESSATQLVAKALSDFWIEKDIRFYHHGLVDVDGVTMDFAHHGPGAGSRKWLEANNASWYLRDLMQREIFNGKVPPRLVIRADKHVFTTCSWTYMAQGHPVTSQLIVVPSYQSMNRFARKTTKSAFLVSHGMVAVEIVDGVLGRQLSLVQEYDLRTRETL